MRCSAFADDAAYQLVHVSRLYLASLAAAWMHVAVGRRVSFSIATRTMSAPIAALPGCIEDGDGAPARIGPRPRPMRSRRLAAQFLPRFDLLLAARRARRACSARVPTMPLLPWSRTWSQAPRLVPLPGAGQGRRDILFVGNMGYLPNIDAAMWFATRIWPRLRSTVPLPLRFVIAGDGAPREVMNLGKRPGIVLAGGFDDAALLYRRAALAVVPIRAGGGTRIKLLESAKHGVPVVATRFGAEGTGFRSGRELLLADTERTSPPLARDC